MANEKSEQYSNKEIERRMTDAISSASPPAYHQNGGQPEKADNNPHPDKATPNVHLPGLFYRKRFEQFKARSFPASPVIFSFWDAKSFMMRVHV